jgi:starch-binding outer membrane protein, SusD/RagB family
MKKIKIYILGIMSTCLFITSCEEALLLNPEQSLSEEVAYSTAASAEAALNGVYSQCQVLDVFGAGPQIFEELMADNVDFVGSFPTIQDVRNYITVPNNATVEGYWLAPYRVINAANTIIDRVPNIKDPLLTPARSASIIGQAKFLRAILYLQLVNQFAQPYSNNNGQNPGVPLVLTGFAGTIEFPARATVAAVYDQIIKDLTEAKAGVPATYTGILTRARATKGACDGFLSRVHLYKGDYTNAALSAKNVIDNKATYSPATNLSFYSQQTPEDVFVIINTATDNGRTGSGGWASYHRPAAQGGRGDCPFTADLAAVFTSEPGDKRYTELSDTVVAADNARKRMTRKFPDATTNADEAPIMRIAELMLNRAEALAEANGITQEAIDLVNPLRTRAGLPAWTTTTFANKEAFIAGILRERRKELCFEGHRRADLLRRKQPLRTSGPQAALAAYGAPKTILPIPQREIDLNKNLVQNVGYN